MPLQIGQSINNRYLIQALVGQGGMGAVYRAYDQQLQRVVAIKESIPDANASPQGLMQARQQFAREAQALANLTHLNLPRTFDVFSFMGNEYIVMELIEGQTLEQVSQQVGAIHESTVLAWADQILDALEYMHRRGVIHRDIKPSNIVLKPDRQVVLVDFGLVKLIDASNQTTLSALQGMGTAEYAPIEQFSRGMRTDARSDIYSLGATLYHLLSGRAPLEVPKRLVDPSGQPALRALVPSISARTEAVVNKALEIQPQNRYQTAAEMREAFKTAAVPPEPIPSERRWLVAAIGALVILLLLLGAGAVFARDILFPAATTRVANNDFPTTTPLGVTVPAKQQQDNPLASDLLAPTETPTASATSVPPTATATPVPPTATATQVPPTETPLPSDTPPPTRRPNTPTAVTTRQPTKSSTGLIYPAPNAGGMCGTTLAPGDFVLDISFSQPLKQDEAFDIRSRHADELGTTKYRGVAVTRENSHTIRAKVNDPDTWPDAFGVPAWGRNFLTVAVIRLKDGKFAEQLSPESNTCLLLW